MAAHSRPEHSLLMGRSFLSRRDPSVRLTSYAKLPVLLPGMSSHLACRKCQGDAARCLLVQLASLLRDLNPHPHAAFLKLVGIRVMRLHTLPKSKIKAEVENMQIHSIDIKLISAPLGSRWQNSVCARAH